MKGGRIVAILNHKGGVAKTTTTINVADIMARRGMRILMVDVDPQKNLTFAMLGKANVPRGIFDSMVDGRDVPIVEVRENLYMAPSSIALSGIDTLFANVENNKTILARLLYDLREHFDFIFIDCCPGLNLVTYNAIMASDGVFIPLTPNALSRQGLETTMDILKAVERSMWKHTDVDGIIVTQYHAGRNLDRRVVAYIREFYGNAVFNTMIRDNIAVAESVLFQKTIMEHAPRSNGALDYMALTNEIIERYNNKNKSKS